MCGVRVCACRCGWVGGWVGVLESWSESTLYQPDSLFVWKPAATNPTPAVRVGSPSMSALVSSTGWPRRLSHRQAVPKSLTLTVHCALTSKFALCVAYPWTESSSGEAPRKAPRHALRPHTSPYLTRSPPLSPPSPPHLEVTVDAGRVACMQELHPACRVDGEPEPPRPRQLQRRVVEQ